MRLKRAMAGVAKWALTMVIVPLSSTWFMSLRGMSFWVVHLKEHRVCIGLAKGAVGFRVLPSPGIDAAEVLRQMARRRGVLEREDYHPKSIWMDDENDAESILEVVRSQGPTWWPRSESGAHVVPIWIPLLPVVCGATVFWRASITAWRRRRRGDCLRCGYSLSGLAGPAAACPECGNLATK